MTVVERLPGSRRRRWFADCLASLVVCLVALPLCLGIAIASGVPPALGLVTGIVGGIAVGLLQSSVVSVSGPAAGLTVLVAEIVREGGVALLSAVTLAAGLLQVVIGLVRAGRWFRAVPPSLVHGMLAGIGVLIAASQLHTMVDRHPAQHGLDNLVALPRSAAAVLSGPGPHRAAALVGALTIGVLLAWRRWSPPSLGLVPAPLVGVAAATALAEAGGLAIARVDVPSGLLAATDAFGREALALLGRLDTWGAALAFALVASAETLLCVGAVDRMVRGARTNYDRELRAQGVGNAICGALGALPMTAVIVRSSTNVQAGARTRASAVLHGVWILLVVSLAPGALRLVPVSSLAAVLVFTGWRLLDRRTVARLHRHGRTELLVYVVTAGSIVAFDLLRGVLFGLVVAALALLSRLARLEVEVEHDVASRRSTLRLLGSATFLRLPDLAEALDRMPPDREVHVRLDGVGHVDHGALELLADWERTHRDQGGHVVVDWEALDLAGRGAVVDLTDRPGPPAGGGLAGDGPDGERRVGRP